MYLIGFTSLHFASASHKVGVAMFLLQRGADPNLPTPLGGPRHHDEPGHGAETALHLAASKGDMDIMRILISHKADANAIDIFGNQLSLHFFAFNERVLN